MCANGRYAKEHDERERKTLPSSEQWATMNYWVLSRVYEGTFDVSTVEKITNLTYRKGQVTSAWIYGLRAEIVGLARESNLFPVHMQFEPQFEIKNSFSSRNSFFYSTWQ